MDRGLDQDMARRAPIALDGPILDTRTAIPPLTPDERARLTDLQNVDKQNPIIMAKVKQRSTESDNRNAKRIARKRGDAEPVEADFAAARKARETGVLPGEHVITMRGIDGDESVSVAEILANPSRYERRRSFDPLEVDYNGGAEVGYIFRGDSGRLVLFSHAHGGRSYELGTTADHATEQFEAEPMPAGMTKEKATRSVRSPEWTRRLRRAKAPDGSDGNPLAILENAVIAFRYAPEFDGVLRWDAFGSRVELSARPPWVLADVPFTPRELRDDDFSWAQVWLSQQVANVSKEITRDAILMEARHCEFHPVRDYLDSLKWDGTARISVWLIDHLGADDTALNRAIGRKWLVSAVARVLAPGCKVDTMLILEGVQGAGKSSALGVLGGAWFSDHIPDLASKDAMLQIQGRWIIEMAEMDAMRRAETSRLKAFLSTRVDRFRAPYGIAPQDYPRQCVIAGTINPDGNEYLHDATGARRMWPITCGADWPAGRKVDLAALARARDQLWAEAVKAYRDGAEWWIADSALETAAAEAAENRFAADSWEDRIADFISGRESVTTAVILEHCIYGGQSAGAWKRADETRIGIILRRLGWRHGARKADRKRQYVNPNFVTLLG